MWLACALALTTTSGARPRIAANLIRFSPSLRSAASGGAHDLPRIDHPWAGATSRLVVGYSTHPVTGAVHKAASCERPFLDASCAAEIETLTDSAREVEPAPQGQS